MHGKYRLSYNNPEVVIWHIRHDSMDLLGKLGKLVRVASRETNRPPERRHSPLEFLNAPHLAL